jgi:hypothetical protein
MPTTGGSQTTAHIVVHVGFDGTLSKYFSSDEKGESERTIDLIGGPFATAISWTIFNRTDHSIGLRLHRFRQGGADKCPVIGGDLLNCEFESLDGLDPGEQAVVETAIVLDGDRGLYDYDLDVKNWSTGVGNTIDPELQIDN